MTAVPAGMLPLPFMVSHPGRGQVIAAGGELKNTFCIGVDNRFYLPLMWEILRFSNGKSPEGNDRAVGNTSGGAAGGSGL